MTATTEVRGWIVVDKTTGALDWDGELHPSEDAARESLNSNVRFNDPDWRPFEIYDVLPVLAAFAVPATGETPVYELFPGTREALDALTIRKDATDE